MFTKDKDTMLLRPDMAVYSRFSLPFSLVTG